MRLTGRVLAGVFAIAVLAAALVAGAVAGWMLRGEDGVDSARPADMSVEVVADLVERVLARGSTALTADEIREKKVPVYLLGVLAPLQLLVILGFLCPLPTSL